jgi:hypothetical protein
MEKLVWALRVAEGAADRTGQDVGARLRDATAHAVAAAGARGIQVSAADADVKDALVRITSFDTPVVAVVSTWVDAAATAAPAIEAALAATEGVDRVGGWLVTESVPLAPPAVALGARTPGFANVAFLRRPAELDVATWLDRWQGHHTRVAIETQSTFGYVQDVVVRPVTEGAPPVDGIVEELFPIEALTDLHAFFGSGGDDDELTRRMTVMGASVASFGADQVIDVVPTSRYVVTSPFPS